MSFLLVGLLFAAYILRTEYEENCEYGVLSPLIARPRPEGGYSEDKGDFEIPVEDEPEEAGEEDNTEE